MQGSGIWILDVGSGVVGSKFTVWVQVENSGFRVWGSGFRILGLEFWIESLEFGISVWGLGLRVLGSVQCSG